VTDRRRRAGSAPTAQSNNSAVSRVGPDPEITVLDLPGLTADRLDRLLRGGDGDGGWLGAYPASNLREKNELEYGQRMYRWASALDELLPEFWQLFGGELDTALKEMDLKVGARLIWLPSSALGILPLAAAQNPVTKRWLADDYEIVYAPSLEALTAAQANIAIKRPATLAAIVNPTKDLPGLNLPGTEVSGQLAGSYFASEARTVLVGTAASSDAVLRALDGKSLWHFGSHGTFDWDDVLQSGLLMHAKVPLTVAQLQEVNARGRPRLVVLQACETGLYDISRNPDEFVGLPGAFMTLGASGVLSTLWPVDETASTLLMAKFYELYMGSARLPPPTALRHAQAWLRSSSGADLRAYIRLAAAQGQLARRQLTSLQEDLAKVVESYPTPKKSAPVSNTTRPYDDPYFWAVFLYTGI
jgi:CHAT domain-containing protein